MMTAEDAYKKCENVIKQHSNSFYTAFRKLPKQKRNAVWAIYTLCRTIDNIVDEGKSPKEELIEFEREWSLFLKGEFDSNHYMWVALHESFQQFQLDGEPINELLQGQKMDLEKSRYESLEEVLYYSYLVAGTVGVMLLPILAPRKKKSLHNSAVSLGLAMQLTNILRDIGEDYEVRNRVYLPQEAMAQFGYSDELIGKRDVNQEFISVWEYLAFEAEAYYEEAFDSINEYPLYSRNSVKAAAYFYKAILNKIRMNNYQVFNDRHSITSEEKQSILAEL
ncbi:phytoene/squalene synthase family protein [Bacillus gobiensis]|uniref:phytoene/squalene synthase family protein n=1 Tax=Bacillus gobiensis TaxID=1441095 RepID=UPI003D225BC6